MSFAALKEMFAEIGDYLYQRYIYVDLTPYENFSPKGTALDGVDIILKSVPTAVIALTIGLMIASIFVYREKRQTVKLVQALLHAKCFDEESAKTAEELGVRMSFSLSRRLKRPSALSKLVYYKGQALPVSELRILHEKEEEEETAEPTDAPLEAPTEEAEAIQQDDSAKEESDAKNTEESDAKPTEEPETEEESEERYRAWVLAMKERRKLDFGSTPLYIPKRLSYRADVRYGTMNRPRSLVMSLILLPLLGYAILYFYPKLLLLADAFITLLN